MAAIYSTQWEGVSRNAENVAAAGDFPTRATAWGISHSRRGAAASLVLLGLNGWGLLRQWLAAERG